MLFYDDRISVTKGHFSWDKDTRISRVVGHLGWLGRFSLVARFPSWSANKPGWKQDDSRKIVEKNVVEKAGWYQAGKLNRPGWYQTGNWIRPGWYQAGNLGSCTARIQADWRQDFVECIWNAILRTRMIPVRNLGAPWEESAKQNQTSYQKQGFSEKTLSYL